MSRKEKKDHFIFLIVGALDTEHDNDCKKVTELFTYDSDRSAWLEGLYW